MLMKFIRWIAPRLPGGLELLSRTRDGRAEIYLARYRLLPRNRVFNVYIHQFFASDAEGMHDHPCDWLIRGLAGWYVEETFTGYERRHAGRWRFMSAEQFHRVIVPRQLAGKVWTLAIRGPNRKTWGFLDHGVSFRLWTKWNHGQRPVTP
jgi:hypothetical protein